MLWLCTNRWSPLLLLPSSSLLLPKLGHQESSEISKKMVTHQPLKVVPRVTSGREEEYEKVHGVRGLKFLDSTPCCQSSWSLYWNFTTVAVGSLLRLRHLKKHPSQVADFYGHHAAMHVILIPWVLWSIVLISCLRLKHLMNSKVHIASI